MPIIVSLTVDGEEFALGQVFEDVPSERIDCEEIVPYGETHLPYVWVHGESATVSRTELEAAEHVQSIEVLADLPDRALIQIEWAAPINGLLEAISDQQAAILEASRGAERWRFRLRFPDAEATAAFHRECHEADIRIEITGVHDSTRSDFTPTATALTDAQREILALASERGYFDIPRETTIVELATELGVSNQAVSERLRRAQNRLVSAHIHH